MWFENVQKIQFHSSMTRITGTLHEDLYTFKIVSRWVLLRMRHVWDKRCRENRNTHFMVNNVFEKIVPLWDSVENLAEPDIPQMTT